MARPSDWFVLDLEADPTPGAPDRVEILADRFHDFAEVSERAYRSVTSLQGDSAIMSWVGLSGDAFREQFGGFPDQLRKLYTSHEMAGDALTAFAPQLTQAQAQADRALADGREARARLTSVTGALDSAKANATGASSHAEQLNTTAAGTPPPDPDQVAQAVRDAQAAKAAQSSAQGAVDSAQAALDAAKSLAEQARQMRDSAAGSCAQQINEASDAGIKPRSFWQKLGEFFKQLWDVICEVAKWVALVAGVIAMIIGGPLAWIALAAGAILLIKAIVDFSQGKGSVMDLVFGILGIIPGVKGLTTLGRLKELYRAGGLKAIGQAALANAKNFLPALANVIRNGNAGTFIQKVFIAPFRGAGNDLPPVTTPHIPAAGGAPIRGADDIPPVQATDDIPPAAGHVPPTSSTVPPTGAADDVPIGGAGGGGPAVVPLPTPKPTAWRPRRTPADNAPPPGSNIGPDSRVWNSGDALTRYLGGGALPLNKFLRNLDGPGGPKFDTPATLTQNADILSTRLGELPPVDARTFRGVEGDLGVRVDPITGNSTPLQVGDSWSDAGFMSTSVDAGKANEFIATGGKLDGINESGLGTLFTIEGRSGRDVKDFTGLPESEILFDKGTKFTVTNISSTEVTINNQVIQVRVIDLVEVPPINVVDNLPPAGAEVPPVGGGDNLPPIGGPEIAPVDIPPVNAGDNLPPVGAADNLPPAGGADNLPPAGAADNLPPAPAPTPDPHLDTSYLPSNIEPKPGHPEQSVYVDKNFPDVDLTLIKADGLDPEVFHVGKTDELVYRDPDTLKYVKFEGTFDSQTPAAFSSVSYPKSAEHFTVLNFETAVLPRIDTLDSLRSLPISDNPVLVRTDQLGDIVVRTDADTARIDSIVKAYRDGTPLGPIGLSKDDLSINGGNHRLAAARLLGLDYIPVQIGT